MICSRFAARVITSDPNQFCSILREALARASSADLGEHGPGRIWRFGVPGQAGGITRLCAFRLHSAARPGKGRSVHDSLGKGVVARVRKMRAHPPTQPCRDQAAGCQAEYRRSGGQGGRSRRRNCRPVGPAREGSLRVGPGTAGAPGGGVTPGVPLFINPCVEYGQPCAAQLPYRDEQGPEGDRRGTLRGTDR